LKTRYRIVKLRNGKYKVLRRVFLRWGDYRFFSPINSDGMILSFDDAATAEKMLLEEPAKFDIIEVVKEL
jgi:hypothetical protein